MSQPIDLLAVYLHLARTSAQRQRPLVRDRLLVLSAVLAARIHLPLVAAHCRQQVLDHNHGHMLRRWPTVEDALEDTDFLHLLKQLQRRYPQEKAEQMLAKIGIDLANERAAYFSDNEYAAALLGETLESLERRFGDG